MEIDEEVDNVKTMIDKPRSCIGTAQMAMIDGIGGAVAMSILLNNTVGKVKPESINKLSSASRAMASGTLEPHDKKVEVRGALFSYVKLPQLEEKGTLQSQGPGRY